MSKTIEANITTEKRSTRRELRTLSVSFAQPV
jgi:hypothetical protein